MGIPAITTNTLQTIICNLTGGGAVKTGTLEGKKYRIVPMVMAVEGVLNGSGGKLYYPKEELKKTPCVWNHKPIVVYHPSMNGAGISACSPEVLNTQKIGLIMNAKFESPALKAEAWLDMDRVEEIDDRIKTNLDKGIMTEVSTGLFTDNEATEGTFKGKKYDGIARNYRPDHLAVLPDQVGACSVADGAGLLRNAASFSDIQSRLQALLDKQNTKTDAEGATASPAYSWIVDTYEDFFIYRAANTQGYTQQRYTKGAAPDTVEFVGDPVEVFMHKEWRTVDNEVVGNVTTNEDTTEASIAAAKIKENQKMDKIKIIAALVANGSFSKEQEPILNGMSDVQLTDLHTKLVGNCDTTATPKTETPATPATVETPAQNAAQTPAEALSSFMASAPAPVQELLTNALNMHESTKTGLVAEITANADNSIPKEVLQTMTINTLQGIAGLAKKKPCPTVNAAPNQSLWGLPASPAAAPTTNAAVEDPLPLPVFNFAAAK